MKSQTNTQSRPILTKKPSTKALNQKKNSILLESTLKKQKSKPNLILNHPQESTQNTTSSNLHKLTSPKNTLNNHSISMMTTLKTQPNQDSIKPQKSQLNKKTLPTNKIRKTGLSKNQPIKKQFLTNLRSPKNLKSNAVQSQIFLTEKQHYQNGQSLLNIQLDTSIIKTQHFQDHMSQNHHESQVQISFLKQNSTKTIPTHQQSQIQELTKTSKQQNQQILRLKSLNEEMQKKLNKLKSAQDEHKKKLRQRISTFNEQGEEIRQLKEKILGLEKQIERLLKENNELKNRKVEESIKKETITMKEQQQVFQGMIKSLQEQERKAKNYEYKIVSVLNLQILPQKSTQKNRQKGIMIDESVMTSFDDSICDGVLSFINGNSSVNLQESLLSNEKPKDLSSQSCQFIGNLQIQTIKNTYEQKYKQKIYMMETKYREGLKDVQNRINLFQTESKEIVKNQQQEIISLQKKIDDLYEKLQDSKYENTKKKGPSINIDQGQLKHMMEINSYKKKITQKDQQLKKTRQQIHIKQIQCKRICAQLDIERIKHSLNTQVSTLNKQIINESQNQQTQIIIQELKIQKEKNHKLTSQNLKKQELIKKISSLHQNNINKKIKK